MDRAFLFRGARHCLHLLIASLLLGVSALAMAADAAAPRVQGIEGPLAANVQAHLSGLTLDCAATPVEAQTYLTRARNTTRNALEALGHYQAKIDSRLTRSENCWQLVLTIEPGPVVKLARVDLGLTGQGKNDPALQAVLPKSELKPGAPLDQGVYEQLKTRLEQRARERGYFDARFTAHRIRVDPAAQSAEVELVLDTGPRYAFGATDIVQTALKPGLARRFLTYKTNDPYDQAKLQSTQQALLASGYFSNVLVQPQVKERANGQVPIRITATPRPPREILFGAGYSTDTGPRGRAEFHNHRATASGHRYGIQLQASELALQAGANYEIPLENPLKDWLRYAVGYQDQVTDTSHSRTWEVGVHRTRLLDSGWLADAARAEVGAASEAVGSSVDFSQGTLALRGVYPLITGVMFGRINLGATDVSSITRLPATLRFFAGGDQSVRGYGYQSLGPKDANGNVIGGKYLATASLEFDHHLVGDFDWAVFYDIGNAFDTLPATFYRGAGLGVRWRSPIGPIRFDLAHPIDEPDGGVRLHISMGAFL
ncbi:MAG: autotransporter assembly complex protein TamA [Gammaproteobacteria bacterium]